MTLSTDDLGRITQQTAVIAADGDRLGTVGQVYTSDTTGDPAWVTLKTGLFGTQESFVPLADASFDGDDVRVAVTKDAVHGAPRVDADGHLGVDEEDDLYRHYGLDNPARPDADRNDTDRHDTDRHDTDRHDTDRHDTDRDDELAQRDVEGRDEVADVPDAAPRRAQDEVPAEDHDQDDVKPGERTTRLRRYVVTERVVQTIEELPDEPSR